jgi:ribosome-binding factor A
MKTRLIRINDEIARVVANTIRSEMSDPRVGTVVSVVRSETTNDLKTSKIFVSVIGGEDERNAAMTALSKAAGFIRKRVADTINLRQTPEIMFIYDDSIEHGMRMRRLIDEVNAGSAGDSSAN